MKKTLTIHTENILPIIKKWLYSDKDIFIRELVSNACDAISKLKILREQGETPSSDDELRIDLKLDKDQGTLTFSDTGLGMTAEEVEKYIAQVAFSGAEEFLSKYKSQKESDQVIGHFGLGFYSAYMVAAKVTINTLSHRADAQPALWSCEGGIEYSLEKGTRESRGTDVTLFIDEENRDYLDENRIREILTQYCAFLPYPIFLGGERINKEQPLWTKSPSNCTEEEYRAFYHQLYPLDPEPHFWIHLNIDYPFNLKGILYFPKLHKRFDYQKCQIKLFSNRVFVSENCTDLLPEYLTMLRGALDSPDIPLNVSRSSLQMDRTVRTIATHISKKVADRLSTLYRNERETFFQHWEEISLIVKLGAMQDDKFYDRVKELLVWKNLEGQWLSLDDYRSKHPDSKIFYTQDAHSPFLNLYKEKGIDVLLSTHPVDTALMHHLEHKENNLHFQRIDGALDKALLDEKREKNFLDAEGRTESSRIADFVRHSLLDEKLEIEAKSLSSDHLPAFLVLDEQMRRMRDYFALSAQDPSMALPTKKTFVVNTNNPLIQRIYGLKDKEPALATEMLQHLYDQALLSQKELPLEKVPQFIERANQVWQQLLEKTT